MTKEFIIAIGGDTYLVYANERNPIDVLLDECNYHLNNSNKDMYQSHWKKIIKLIKKSDYTITENFDFRGVRKIVR